MSGIRGAITVMAPQWQVDLMGLSVILIERLEKGGVNRDELSTAGSSDSYKEDNGDKKAGSTPYRRLRDLNQAQGARLKAAN